MDIAEKLKGMHSAFPECKTVAYADISTGMILYASALAELRQEHLDALCSTAMEMLNGATARLVGPVLGGGDRQEVFDAIIVEADEVGVFVKSTENPADAICAVASPGLDLGGFRRDARACLAAMGSEK